MNCRQFENAIVDIARNQILEAATRDSALAHTDNCAACARRLEDEQALTGGLRAVASSAAVEQAPARLEAALLESFRKQDKAAHSTSPAALSPASERRWPRWGPGVAAAAAVILMLVTARLIFTGTPSEQARDAQNQETSPAVVKDAGPQPATTAVAQEEPKNNPVAPPEKARPVSRRQRGAGNSAQLARDRRTKSTESARTRENDAEIATSFLPLVHGENLNDVESGHLMRVELPRSALTSFGLPVNMERANERIKADVLVGNDGVARAIRFVR